jgi:hypothetical protein
MLTKKLLLFLIGCIGTRIILLYIAKSYPTLLRYLGIFTLAIGLGFFYYYFTGKRTTGPETFGDKIWWNDLRPIHGSLYILFSILAFQNKDYAWMILAIDVIIGLSAFLIFHLDL